MAIDGLPPQIQTVIVEMAGSGNMMGGNIEEQLKNELTDLAISGKLQMGAASQDGLYHHVFNAFPRISSLVK